MSVPSKAWYRTFETLNELKDIFENNNEKSRPNNIYLSVVPPICQLKTVWALSSDDNSMHYKMPTLFFRHFFSLVALYSLPFLHYFNWMQGILFTLKCNKSTSACVLMNFVLEIVVPLWLWRCCSFGWL